MNFRKETMKLLFWSFEFRIIAALSHRYETRVSPFRQAYAGDYLPHGIFSMMRFHTPSQSLERTFGRPRRLQLRAPSSIARARVAGVFQLVAEMQTMSQVVGSDDCHLLSGKSVWRLLGTSKDTPTWSFRLCHRPKRCFRQRAYQRHVLHRICRLECWGCN